jgi:hypothetical protein
MRLYTVPLYVIKRRCLLSTKCLAARLYNMTYKKINNNNDSNNNNDFRK